MALSAMKTHLTNSHTFNSEFLFPCDYIIMMHFLFCIRILAYIMAFRIGRFFFFERESIVIMVFLKL